MKRKNESSNTTVQKNSKKYKLNKIIYFDKETIKNILQEYNKGTKQSVINSTDSTSLEFQSNVEAETEIKISLPFWARAKFFFSSKIAAQYISKIDNTVTVTSTELSDFEKIKKGFKEFNNITISDIENSATFFRVAGNYIRILKGGVKDVDVKEFKNVMEGYEGYDHYKIDDSTYIRFNSSAFLSNYKRNDLMNSCLKIYCIFVGKFAKENFNFIEQINKMQQLSTDTVPQTLAELYPCLNENDKLSEKKEASDNPKEKEIILYDVVYASIIHQEEKNEND